MICDRTVPAMERTAFALKYPHSVVAFARGMARAAVWDKNAGHWTIAIPSGGFSSCGGEYIAVRKDFGAGTFFAHESVYLTVKPAGAIGVVVGAAASFRAASGATLPSALLSAQLPIARFQGNAVTPIAGAAEGPLSVNLRVPLGWTRPRTDVQRALWDAVLDAIEASVRDVKEHKPGPTAYALQVHGRRRPRCRYLRETSDGEEEALFSVSKLIALLDEEKEESHANV